MQETPTSIRSAPTGRIDGMPVARLLWDLHRDGASGTLTLRRRDVAKKLFFRDGELVFAVSEDWDDRLGEHFLRTDRLTVDDLETVLPRLGGGSRIGTLLVERGLISSEHLEAAVREQVSEFVLDLFTWNDGHWSFEEGDPAADEDILLDRGMGELLLEGFTRERSFTRLRRIVGPLTVRLRLARPGEAAELDEDTRSLVEALEDGPRELGSLLDGIYLSHFEAYQRMAALRTMGIVEEVEPELVVEGADRQGALDARGPAPLLVELCRAGETGVLRLVGGERERSLHLQDGAPIFATSNDHEDGLLAFLMRRGVISLRHREEVARRLLTNKRIGEILLDIGAIDAIDLERMVRDHLRALVRDTLTWESGRFAYRSGPLPSVEPIVLSESIEALVADAYRSVHSWTKLRRGSGGLDRPVRLSPDHEAVLDRMEIGPEEWELLALLCDATTGRELCRQTEIGAFRVAKILWILRTLGAVESVPREEWNAILEERNADLVAAASALEENESPDRADADGDAGDDASDPDPGVAEEEPITADSGLERSAAGTESDDGIDDDLDDDLDGPDEDRFRTRSGAERVVDAVAEGRRIEVEDADPGDRTQVISDETVKAALEAPQFAARHDEGRSSAADALEEDLDEIEAVDPADPQKPDYEFDGVDDDEYAAIEREAVREAEGLEPTGDSTIEQIEVEDDLRRDLDDAVAEGEEALEPFDEPAELAAAIDRLNARQRVVFRTIKAEVGAGAINFVRSCADRVRVDTACPFEQAELQPDGSWDPNGLRAAVRRGRIDDPEIGYREVIEAQVEMLREQIGPQRVEQLEREIDLF